MSRYKSYFQLFVAAVKANGGQLACSLGIMLLSTLVFSVYAANPNGLSFSLADGFVAVSTGILFYCNLVILPVLFTVGMNSRDFTIQVLLRSGRKRRLWCKQLGFAWGISLVFLAFQILFLFLCFGWKCSAAINFDQRHSMFSYANDGRTLVGLPFAEFVIVVLLYLVLSVCLYAAFFLLLRWIFTHSFWPLSIVIVCSVVDMANIGGISTWMGVGYGTWLARNPVSNLCLAFLLCALILIGALFSDRKEFAHAK